MFSCRWRRLGKNVLPSVLVKLQKLITRVHSLLIGQVPHAMIIHKIAPRIWLSSMTLIWAGLTMASAACTTFSQLAAVRFFMGLTEACTYPALIYVMGSW